MSDGSTLFGKEFFDPDRQVSSSRKWADLDWNETDAVYGSYSFEHWYPIFHDSIALPIKDQFNPATVLDIGCAKGFLVYAFMQIGTKAHGVDISNYAISKAPIELAPYLHRIDLDKDSLPFKGESFDFVTFLGTIEYLRDFDLVLKEIYRILRQGGHLYLRTACHRTSPTDLRINIHSKDFWVRELESRGFKSLPKELATLERGYLGNKSKNLKQIGKFKLRAARLIYNQGGHIGRHGVSLVTKFLGRYANFANLLFVKEKRQE